MRVITILGSFLLIAAIIIAFIYGFNRDTFQTLIENRQGLAEGSEWVEKTYSLLGLTEFINEHPEHVSIVSMVAGEPDSILMFEPDTPRPLGTLSNLILLIAYADAFERELEDPEQRISWADVSRYQLPGLSELVHSETFQYAQRQGMIDQQETLSLQHALQLLARFNGLALSDYLLRNLTPGQIEAAMESAGLEHTDRPLPFSGIYLTMAPSLHEQTSSTLLDYREEQPRAYFELEVEENTVQWLSGELREVWSPILSQNRLGLNFMEERDILSLFPSTTAREAAMLASKLWDETLISGFVSRQVKEWMRWHMEGRGMERNFSDYGALYDNRIGLLNGIDFGTSVYTGQTTIQAVFFDRLPIAVWFHMSSNHMHQDFQQRLIWDPALIDVMNSIATNHES